MPLWHFLTYKVSLFLGGYMTKFKVQHLIRTRKPNLVLMDSDALLWDFGLKLRTRSSCSWSMNNLGYSNGGVHQKRRSPNSINWVYFGQIIVKSTQFGQNWVLSFKKGILMGGKLDKNWYKESQIFEVWQAHPHTILVKVTPRANFTRAEVLGSLTISIWHKTDPNKDLY